MYIFMQLFHLHAFEHAFVHGNINLFIKAVSRLDALNKIYFNYFVLSLTTISYKIYALFTQDIKTAENISLIKNVYIFYLKKDKATREVKNSTYL